MKRAQAEIIAGVIVLAAIVLLLLPFVLSFTKMQGETVRRQSDVASYHLAKLSEQLTLSIRPTERGEAYFVNNTGTVSVTIIQILITDLGKNSVYFINLSKYQPSTSGPIYSLVKHPHRTEVRTSVVTLSPGEALEIATTATLLSRKISLALLSGRGVLHAWNHVSEVSDMGRMRITYVQNLFDPSHFELKASYLEGGSPGQREVGVRSYRFKDDKRYYYYELSADKSNFVLENENVRNVVSIVIGVNEPGSFNMLIVNSTLGGSQEKHHRIKLEGFVPSKGFLFKFNDESNKEVRFNENNLSMATGVYVFPEGSNPTLILKGWVNKMQVFSLRESTGGDKLSPYTPFVIMTDIDKNGVKELILSTEEGPIPGNLLRRSGPRDCGRDKEEKLFDQSAVRTQSGVQIDSQWGITFRLIQHSLDPRLHSAAHVVLRIFYHDTEGEPPHCLSPTHMPIVKVSLVRQDWSVVDSRVISFAELAMQERTWPPTVEFSSYSLVLFVPPGEREALYVAISLIDPFNDPSTQRRDDRRVNDVDFLIAVELVGITLVPK